MKKLTNKKGFTLVEMIVSMAVTALIIAAVTMMVGPMSAAISSMKSNANYDTACDAANSYFRYELQTAKKAEIIEFVNGDDADVVNYISGISDTTTVKALAVYDGQLYDLGQIKRVDGNLLSKLSFNYRVFNTEFYNGYLFNAAFQSQTETGGTNCKWIKIVSQFVDSSGDIANQSREMTFKVFGGSMVVTGSDVAAGKNFVVFYTVPDLPSI